MTPEQLDAIRLRSIGGGQASLDRRVLLAEIDRLRSVVESVEADIDNPAIRSVVDSMVQAEGDAAEWLAEQRAAPVIDAARAVVRSTTVVAMFDAVLQLRLELAAYDADA